MSESIALSQKLYLLGIHPENGDIFSASYSTMGYVLVGSLLLELYQFNSISFQNKRIIRMGQKRFCFLKGNHKKL